MATIFEHSNEGQFRKFTIEKKDNFISCIIEAYVIGDHSSHGAFLLSWGPPENTLHKIKCNSFARNVGSDLYEALLQIGNLPERKFWVDLIYISQDDDAEKARNNYL